DVVRAFRLARQGGPEGPHYSSFGRHVDVLEVMKLSRLRESRAEPLVTKVRADVLRADVRAMKRLARLLRPADVVQQLAQRDFRLPILNRIAELDGQVERLPQVGFGAIPVPLRTRHLARQPPSFDEVLARAGTGREIEARGAVVARGAQIA